MIRPLEKADLPKIVARYTFPWSTPEKTLALWETYFNEQQKNVRTVFIVEEGGEILGYGSFLRQPECPYFATAGIPEINALWIDEKHQRRGLGTALIQQMEKLALQEGYKEIGIGVGLYRDYGPAQRLYFKLGYAPEGSGVTYKGLPTVPGEPYPLDDELILWLTKSLRPQGRI